MPEMMKQLFATGAHFGYSKSRNHPSTKGVVYGYKGGSALIDLEKTISALEKAKAFLRGLGMEGKKLILVGTKAEAKLAVARVAELLDVPYVNARWLGGTFTNFSQIKSRIDRLADLKNKRETGALEVYTKKERLMIDREIVRLERYLGTLSKLTELPAAVLVVDSAAEAIVVAEAKKTKVAVISLSNTDSNLAGIDYPIVVNDGSAPTIRLVLEQLAAAYREGLAAPKVAPPSA